MSDDPASEAENSADPTAAERRDAAAQVQADVQRAQQSAVAATKAAQKAHKDAELARLHAEVASEDFVRDSLPLGTEGTDGSFGPLGKPLGQAPFMTGLALGGGALLAWWLFLLINKASGSLLLIVVALFLAFGLNPPVEWLMHRGLKRAYAVLVVILGVVAALTLFIFSLAPVIGDQTQAIIQNAPGWLDELQKNRQIQRLDDKWDFISKIKDYVTSGDLAAQAFGGVLGIANAILSGLANGFIVVVLTLYFLASLPKVKRGMYSLAPASRRPRVTVLGDQILAGVGGYVSGAFVVALCAGVSTFILLAAVGMGDYALALAVVVALLDVIPMIGATIGAVIVCAIAFAVDPTHGIICLVFFLLYQQVENYVIYPRVMSRSVDIPGAMTVIAAIIGAALLGVVGALLAIPTAAAILLLVREVWVKRQDTR